MFSCPLKPKGRFAVVRNIEIGHQNWRFETVSRNKSPKGQLSLTWVQHAQKVKYIFSNQGR